MYMNRKFLILICSLILLWLNFGSCAIFKKSNVVRTNGLISKVWDLTTFNSQQTMGTGIFIIFTDSTNITGFDGCRIFNAKIKMKNSFNVLEFTPSGNRACDTANIESRFLSAFKKVDQMKFYGKKLVLNVGGKSVFQFKERIIIDEPELQESTNSQDSTK